VFGEAPEPIRIVVYIYGVFIAELPLMLRLQYVVNQSYIEACQDKWPSSGRVLSFLGVGKFYDIQANTRNIKNM
jgi:hypothetical protein